MPVIEFGPFSLDAERCELRRGGALVRVQRKVFDFLAYLIAHRERLVTKRELLEHVWQDTAVSETALGRTVTLLRRLLEDDAREPRWIATVHGRGYRFLGEVHGEGVATSARREGSSGSAGSPEVGASSPGDVRSVPCGIPREISTDFVGREPELERALAALQDRQSVRIAASIEGLPGIGKTELALRICGICEREGSFRIFWLDAENPDLTTAWADVVAPHLGLEAREPEERARLAVRALESMAEPVLVVLDNVAEWSARLPGPRPRGANIRWLVTTRLSHLGGRKFHHIEVPTLDDREARQLMARIAGPEIVSAPGFSGLLDALGGYTLSVELAATFLHRFPEVSPTEYLADLEAGRASGHEAEVGARSLYGDTLERELELLWSRLPDTVRQSWLLAACFAQARASTELSDACGLDRRMRAELRDHHLIEADATGGWSMHRLLRAFGARAGGPEAYAVTRARFLEGCGAYLRRVRLDDGFTLYTPDRPHLDAALHYGDQALEPDAAANCWLRIHVATARYSLGEWASARSLLETVRPFLRAPGFDPLLRVVGGYTLGAVLHASGDWSAAKSLLREAIDAGIQELGEDHPAIVYLQSELGRAALVEGDLPRARRLLEHSLGHAERILGRDHRDTASFRRNLATALAGLGDLARAQALDEQTLAADLAHLGEDHPAVATDRADLAWMFYHQGHLIEAKELLERALAGDAKAGCEQSPNFAAKRRSLATVLRELGQLDDAEELLHQAYAVDVEAMGKSSFRVALDRAELGALRHALGDLDPAKSSLEQGLRSLESALGSRHANIAGYRSRLALVERDLGNLSRAKALLEQVVESDRQSYRTGHPSACSHRSHLAWILRDLGDLDGARSLLEDALATLRKQRTDHPEVAAMQARLAAILRDQGDLDAAKQLAVDATRLARLQPEGWLSRAEIERIACDLLETEVPS